MFKICNPVIKYSSKTSVTGSIVFKSILNVLTEEWGLLDDRMADMLVYAAVVLPTCLRGLCVEYNLTTGLR